MAYEVLVSLHEYATSLLSALVFWLTAVRRKVCISTLRFLYFSVNGCITWTCFSADLTASRRISSCNSKWLSARRCCCTIISSTIAARVIFDILLVQRFEWNWLKMVWAVSLIYTMTALCEHLLLPKSNKQSLASAVCIEIELTAFYVLSMIYL